VRLHRHTDYFGTEVVEFEVSRPHRRLTIDVRARVATREAADPPQATWEALGRPGYREAGGEFLLQTDDASGHPAFVPLLSTASAASNPLASLMLASELIPDRFEYRQGATYVDSKIADLLELGAGVCQDFVHLGLALLRHQGIAARYVSGYLFAAGSETSQEAVSAEGPETSRESVSAEGPETSRESVSAEGPETSRESIEVDTHAWLEALLPVADGGEPVWVGADPTNRGLAGEYHVKIGHGRHYADVPPIKGVYRGAASAKLDARVTMMRLDRGDPASIACA
jgi:transglutaminase-like putative cysteine protease